MIHPQPLIMQCGSDPPVAVAAFVADGYLPDEIAQRHVATDRFTRLPPVPGAAWQRRGFQQVTQAMLAD